MWLIFRPSALRCLTFSRGEASLIVDDPPRVVPIWVRLEEPTLTDWFDVKVVRLTAVHMDRIGISRVLAGRSPGGHHPKIVGMRISLGDVTVKPAKSKVKHRRPGTR